MGVARRPILTGIPHSGCGSIQARLYAAVLLWFVAGICAADVPTPQQECEYRNLAVCSFAPSGMQSMQPGPCPPGSQTIKAAGVEDCSVEAIAAHAEVAPTPAKKTQQLPRRDDLARLGSIERWLIPALIYAAIGVAALLAWNLWRRRRAANTGAPGQVVAVLISAGFAVSVGWKVAGKAFSGAFNAYDNHDSAAPALLASPVWLVTFLLVAFGVFALLMLCWRMFRRIGRP